MIKLMADLTDFEVIRETHQYVPGYCDLTSWNWTIMQIIGTDMAEWDQGVESASTRFQIRFQLRRAWIVDNLKKGSVRIK